MAFATIGTAGIQAQSIDLSTKVTGTLPVPNGGLGIASGTTGQFLKFTGTETLASATAGGITEVDNWRITSNFTGDANPIASNWERNDTDFDKIGTGLSQSSGVFSFPSTGIYLITAFFRFQFSGDSFYNEGEIQVTTNNSSYTTRASNSGFIQQTSGSATQNNSSTSTIIDCTNISNVKFRITQNVADNGVETNGETNDNRTFFTSIRLGDS